MRVTDNTGKTGADCMLNSYLSGKVLTMENGGVVLTPNMYAPMGYVMWVASTNPVSIVPKTQLLTSEGQGHHLKSYSVEYYGIEKGTYN
jgi:hypothetical protein